MRVVLDTNVFVSGVFWSGPPYKILQAWREKNLQLILSPEIFGEYQRVFGELRAQYPNLQAQQDILELLATHGEFCHPKKLPNPVSRDSEDDKFIACALSAQVDCLISGDKDLLVVSGYQGLKILKPKEFLNSFAI